MKTLLLGGTRFVGKALVQSLYSQGFELTLFTRGNRPYPEYVEHLKGDRSTNNGLRALSGRKFDVIVDISGRELIDTQRVLSITGIPKHRFLYVSSAGVYANSNFWPLDEASPIDPKSRHSGKVDTENWLIEEKIPFTSFRPTYIYGPNNYNPIERWFFDRIVNNRPIPIPGNGQWITQLGHVNDLANAMTKSLMTEVSRNSVYNCSSKKGVSFQGIVETAASACGKKVDQLEIITFNPKSLDTKARKAFPLRIGHFLTDISKLERDINWTPNFNLMEGFVDSYKNDYLLNQHIPLDFTSDQKLVGN